MAAGRWVGRGDKIAADQAAVDGMRTMLDVINMRGTVVIGEEEKDEAPMLYNGEAVGSGEGADVDVAVDPLESTSVSCQIARLLSRTAVGSPNTASAVVETSQLDPTVVSSVVAHGTSKPNGKSSMVIGERMRHRRCRERSRSPEVLLGSRRGRSACARPAHRRASRPPHRPLFLDLQRPRPSGRSPRTSLPCRSRPECRPSAGPRPAPVDRTRGRTVVRRARRRSGARRRGIVAIHASGSRPEDGGSPAASW